MCRQIIIPFTLLICWCRRSSSAEWVSMNLLRRWHHNLSCWAAGCRWWVVAVKKPSFHFPEKSDNWTYARYGVDFRWKKRIISRHQRLFFFRPWLKGAKINVKGKKRQLDGRFKTRLRWIVAVSLFTVFHKQEKVFLSAKSFRIEIKAGFSSIFLSTVMMEIRFPTHELWSWILAATVDVN